MKIVLFPNTENQQTIDYNGYSATIGSAEGNTIVIQGDNVEPFHARLIYQNGYWTFSDISEIGNVYLDGVEISSAKLYVGSKIKVGEVSILIMTLDVAVQDLATVTPKPVISINDNSDNSAEIQSDPNFTRVFEYDHRPQRRYSQVLPKIALIFSICGPLIVGIGWLLGGIMAITALLRINNTKSDRKIAWWAFIFSVLWVIAIAGTITAFSLSHIKDAIIAHNEDAANKLIKDIAVAEYLTKHGHLFDRDLDNIGEYVSFIDLRSTTNYTLDVDLSKSPIKHGYRFKIKRSDENSFICTGVPIKYSLTGINSFWIDERGILFNEDRLGKDFDEAPIQSDDSNSKSLLEIVGDELADDLANLAEDAFNNKEYLRCKIIIDNIKNNFPKTAAANALTTLDNNTKPFVIEFKSKEVFERAQAMLEKNQIDAALSTFRTLIKSYPSSPIVNKAQTLISTFAIQQATQCLFKAEAFVATTNAAQALTQLNLIKSKYPEALSTSDINDRHLACNTQAMQMLNDEVKRLIDQAHKLEANNKFEDAYILYLTVRNRYKHTVAAKDIDKVIDKNRKMLDEKGATRLIEEVLELDTEKSTARIVSLLEILTTNYGHTEIFKTNQATLETLSKKTQAHRCIFLAKEQLNKGSYRSALANFELALKEDPTLQDSIKFDLEQCYSYLADAAHANQDFGPALEYYLKFIAIKPDYHRTNSYKILECHYEQAKIDVHNKKYLEAERNLLACSDQYNKDMDFNFLYGKTLMQLEKWEEASLRFQNSCRTNSVFVREARLLWAFTQYYYALDEEEELVKMIFADNELQDIVVNYNIDFDFALRQINFPKMKITKIAANKKPTFYSSISDIGLSLEGLAVEAEKLVYANKKKPSEKRALRSKIRGLINLLPDKLNLIRAYQSSAGFRRQRIFEQLDQVYKLYQALNSGLKRISSKKKALEIIKFKSALDQKLVKLRIAVDDFENYSDLEEQRQRTATTDLDSYCKNLNHDNLNSSEVKDTLDGLRSLYQSSRENDLAVNAMRNIAQAYNICPAINSVILTEPATANKNSVILTKPAQATKAKK